MNPLTSIPGVGKSIAADLNSIGILKVSDLHKKNPETLYEMLNKKAGVKLDRCLLYVLRCAVYYATVSPHKPQKLLWWNWSDKKYIDTDAKI